MSRLIAVDVYKKRIDRYPPEIRNIAKKELRYTPTVDAVEVVRCKDCEYWREGSGIFDFLPYCELTATKCDGEHFCSWGEKSVLRNQN